jgi:hypothetical protein
MERGLERPSSPAAILARSTSVLVGAIDLRCRMNSVLLDRGDPMDIASGDDGWGGRACALGEDSLRIGGNTLGGTAANGLGRFPGGARRRLKFASRVPSS